MKNTSRSKLKAAKQEERLKKWKIISMIYLETLQKSD